MRHARGSVRRAVEIVPTYQSDQPFSTQLSAKKVARVLTLTARLKDSRQQTFFG
jgi:hypothetical protein